MIYCVLPPSLSPLNPTHIYIYVVYIVGAELPGYPRQERVNIRTSTRWPSITARGVVGGSLRIYYSRKSKSIVTSEKAYPPGLYARACIL